MLHRFREQLGTAGLVVAVVALVVALAGGAYAAQNSKKKSTGVIITSINQIKPSVRNQLKGKTGPAGEKGPKGDPGGSGASGKDGASGKSVTVSSVSCGGLGGAEVKQEGAASGVQVCGGEDGESPAGAPFTGAEELTLFGEKPCKEAGGVVYEVESTSDTQIVCNGVAGKSATEPLEAGEQESGTWSVNSSASSGEHYFAISFPRPLPTEVGFAHVHIVGESGNGTTCKGSIGSPLPEPGEFCLYTGLISNLTVNEIYNPALIEGCGKIGCFVAYTPSAVGAEAFGSWAMKK